MAKTYGLDAFGQVEAIRYTFNLQVPGVNLSRSWVWQPKTDHVSYEGKDKDGKPVQVTYQRLQLSSQSDAVKGCLSNVDSDGNNAWQIKAIGVVISTFETRPTTYTNTATALW